MKVRPRLGAIDAGSNAIRVVIAEVVDGELTRIDAERISVRLGHNAYTSGELDSKTIDEAVAAFVQFRQRFDANQVTSYRAVATSAIRNATNRDALLHRLYHEANIELDVIEGEEEARLVRKAVLHAMASSPPDAILDLGGGSLEVNLYHDAAWRGHSLPVGTVRLLETFGLDGPIADAEAGMVRRYAATLMGPIIRGATPTVAAITGGNAEALAKILGDGDPTAPSFALVDLEKGLPSIVGATVEERMTKFGFKKDRAEVIGIAALVFATVARQLGLQRLVAPGVGVREGLLLELAETSREDQIKVEGAHDKALVTAARSFANRIDHNTTHGEHVRFLSRSLFQQLRDVHGLPEHCGVLIEVGALLHDVGEVVNHRGHHKHSEYLIRWGRIPGLDDTGREMVALMARCHRKDPARAKHMINESTLSKEQRLEVRRMTALLRVADGLDTGHRSRIEQIVCTRMGDAIVLDLVAADGPSRDDAQLVRKADMLRDELGLDVRVTVGRPAAAEAANATHDASS